MILLKQIIRQLLCLSILYLSIPASLIAQKKSVSLRWEWKKVSAKQDTLFAKSLDSLIITITKIPDSNSVSAFFHKTVVTIVKKKIKDTLYKRIVNAMGVRTADSIVKSYGSPKDSISFLLSKYLGEIKPGDTIFVKPFLGPGVNANDEKAIKMVLIDTGAIKPVKTTTDVPKPGEANTVFSPMAVGSSLFIPPATMEADWADKFACCNSPFSSANE